MISRKRGGKPGSAVMDFGATIDIKSLQVIFPILILDNNLWMLSAIIEHLDNPEALAWLHDHLDFPEAPPRISELRKKTLLNPRLPASVLEKDCPFCEIINDRRDSPRESSADIISIDNDYPFAPIVSKVLIVRDSHSFSEVDEEGLFQLYSFFQVESERLISLHQELDFLNFGINHGLPGLFGGKLSHGAGASQPHVHSQVTGGTSASYNGCDRLVSICQAYWRSTGRDYLADYFAALRNNGLVLAEDDNALLYVPIGQRFNRELQISVKSGAMSTIRTLDEKTLRSISAYHRLAFRLLEEQEIQSHNVITHSSRFSETDTCGQRLIITLCPRTNVLAFSELLNRHPIVELPWEYAAKLRNILKRNILTPQTQSR
jgi:hypothetical protein